MRGQTKDFVDKFKTDKLNGVYHDLDVLEVGSLDVSGNIRGHFKDFRSYTGVDMRDGPNVDTVLNGHELVEHYGEEKFDVVCCFDTMEHDDKFWVTIDQMKRVLKKGGWLLLGAPGSNCPKHDHPNDYWRFFSSAFVSLMEGLNDIYVIEQIDDPNHSLHDEVYGWGQK